MIALFYDSKNHEMVRSDQLVSINVVAEVIQGDSQESNMLDQPLDILFRKEISDVDGTHSPGLLSWHTLQIGEFGYKTKHCPKYMNFDRWCMLSDLKFIDLVEK